MLSLFPFANHLITPHQVGPSLCTTQCPFCPPLQEARLIFKDAQTLPQASKLCFTAPDTLFIRLWLCNAPVLYALQVLQHSIQLFLDARLVGSCLCERLVKASRFLGLVFDVLLLCDLLNFVVLGFLVIRCLSGLLS